MRRIVGIGLFAVGVLGSRPAEAACSPGQLNGSATCDCPAGYKSVGDPGSARCVPVAETTKSGGSVTTVKSACKSGELDACTKQCDGKNWGSCVVLGRMYKKGEGVSLADQDKAYLIFKKACDAGDQLACVEQGRMHEAGTGTPKDTDKALRLYAKACEAKNAEGCFEVADTHFYGVGVPKDVERSLPFYEKACTAKHLYSCNRLGVIHYDGTGVPRNETKAVKFFATACDGGEGVACANLASAFDDGRGVAKDPPKALTLLDKACTLGHAASCNTLGVRYGKGQGVAEDLSEAYKRFEKACALGHAYGCHNAGYCLETGKGVAKDESTAAIKQDKACKAGAYDGCYSLADQYYEGRGVAQNDVKAAALYKMSCDDGKLLFGCRDYGAMLYQGRGVTKNVPLALTYTKRACDGENGLACHNLGFVYESGAEVPKDLAMARTYYQKGCTYKYTKSCDKLSTLGNDTPAAVGTGSAVLLTNLGVSVTPPAGHAFKADTMKKDGGSTVDILRRVSPKTPYLGMVIERISGASCASKFSAKPGKHREVSSPPYLPEGWSPRAIEYLAPDEDAQMGALLCYDQGGGKLVSAFVLYGSTFDAPDFINTVRPMLASMATGLGPSHEAAAPSSPTLAIDNTSIDTDTPEPKHNDLVHGGFHIGGARTSPDAGGLKEGSALWLGIDFLFSGANKSPGVGLAGKFAMQGAVGTSFIGDLHLGLGPGVRLGPIHFAPLVGAGLDAVTGGDEYFKAKASGYAFFGGDLHLGLGGFGVGFSAMFPRRVVSAVPRETRYAAHITFSKYILSGQYWTFEQEDAARPTVLAAMFGWRF